MSKVCCLDIGSAFIKASLIDLSSEEPRIVGAVRHSSDGIRRGVVNEISDASSSIREAISKLEDISDSTISSCYLAVNGTHLKAKFSQGVVAVSKPDKEITKSDLDRALNAASATTTLQNREIVKVITRHFNIDSEEEIKNPVGMSGNKLEANTLIFTGSKPYIKNLTKSVESAGLKTKGFIPVSLASSEAVLSSRQKDLGAACLDIGAETTNLAVFEEGEIFPSKVFDIGSRHITNDIAIGLRTDIDTASQVKLRYGTCLPDLVKSNEVIDLSEMGLDQDAQVRRVEIAKIIQDRVEEIFSKVKKELSEIDKAGVLPGGISITGGGSKLNGIEDLAKDKLQLPARVSTPREVSGLVDQVSSPFFSASVGLAKRLDEEDGLELQSNDMADESISDLFNYISDFFKNIMP